MQEHTQNIWWGWFSQLLDDRFSLLLPSSNSDDDLIDGGDDYYSVWQE